MNNELYFDKATQDALAIILSSPVINSIEYYSYQQLKKFVKEFHSFVNYFPKYLDALLCRSPYDEFRLAILENLIDESGGLNKIEACDTSALHPELYRKFAYKLGLSKEEMINIDQAQWYTKEMVKALRELSLEKPFFTALGGISPGVENVFSIWIDRVYQGLSAHNLFSKEDLHYFSLHTIVDMEHGYKLKNCILPYLIDESRCQALYDGATSMAHILRNFFHALSSDINNSPAPSALIQSELSVG